MGFKCEVGLVSRNIAMPMCMIAQKCTNRYECPMHVDVLSLAEVWSMLLSSMFRPFNFRHLFIYFPNCQIEWNVYRIVLSIVFATVWHGLSFVYLVHFFFIHFVFPVDVHLQLFTSQSNYISQFFKIKTKN